MAIWTSNPGIFEVVQHWLSFGWKTYTVCKFFKCLDDISWQKKCQSGQKSHHQGKISITLILPLQIVRLDALIYALAKMEETSALSDTRIFVLDGVNCGWFEVCHNGLRHSSRHQALDSGKSRLYVSLDLATA